MARRDYRARLTGTRMSETAPIRRILQFGRFEVDLQEMELRKDGFRVKLRDQSFLLLQALLERPGELVTREELRNRLWPADTFVDFDHSLNAAMKRLRDALGDDPDQPRFIETVPKRGYRFVAAVSGSRRPDAQLIPTSSPQFGSEPAKLEILAQSPAVSTTDIKARRWLWPAIGICVVAGVVSLVLLLYFHRRGHAPAQSTGLANFKVIPFTTLPGLERSPAFSPDGSQIAFAWQDETKQDIVEHKSDIYVKGRASENLIRLTNHPADSISLSWSPDGSQIAFQRLAANDSGLYLVPALGGPERRLRETHADPAGVNWSPDGQWIAFADSPVLGGNHTLNLISVNSLEVKSIPHVDECLQEIFPAFSPDGKKLAYICTPHPGQLALYDVDPSGGAPHLIGRYAGWGGGIAWSRDMKRLVLCRHAQGTEHSEIDEVDLATGQLQKLPFGEKGWAPTISAQGNKLAFEGFDYKGLNIWKRSLVLPGAAPQKIIVSTQASFFPRYSPDGKRIVFISNRSGGNEIWTSNADGGALVQITNMNASSGTPSWAPDGKRIVFDSRLEGRPGVYIADIEERVPHKVQTNINEMSQPFWSHDGKWIYFIGGANAGRIYRCHPDGGSAEALSSDLGSFPQEAWNGEDLYFLSSGTPVLKKISLKKAGAESVIEEMPPVELLNWYVVPQGIYFIPNDALVLEYFEFSSKRISRRVEITGPMMGFSVSPDGRSIAYASVQEDSDIMLVDNWN